MPKTKEKNEQVFPVATQYGKEKIEVTYYTGAGKEVPAEKVTRRFQTTITHGTARSSSKEGGTKR